MEQKSKEQKPIYVIDTNILVDYPDIIPSGGEANDLKEPTVDLSKAHIVIPTAVVRELSSFKKEASERGKAARMVLKRLRSLVEGEDIEMAGSYTLKHPIDIDEQSFSILPVHKNFKKALPFSPSEDDMDGQIILATLATQFIVLGLPVDGEDPDVKNPLWTKIDNTDASKWSLISQLTSPKTRSVTLLTNDNGLAIRATERGISTSRYGYKPPAPYTGRREVMVSEDLIRYFYGNDGIEMDIWELMLPSEAGRKMVANEFLILRVEDEELAKELSNDKFYRYIGRYDAIKNKIVHLRYVSEFPENVMNEGQAIYVEALMSPEFAAVICKGPAGSGKTYMATVYGYYACKTGQYIGVTVVPCATQSRIGALPGTLNEKMDPDVQPLKNALRNFFLKTDRNFRAELKILRERSTKAPKAKLPDDLEGNKSDEEDNRSLRQKLRDRVDAVWDKWFANLPIESARGRDFSEELALYDEFQDQNATQADTLIKRLGNGGKIVLTGDTEQIHAPYLDSGNNGLVYATQLLYDNPMVAQVYFTEAEVVRHPLVKAVAERQKKGKEPTD